MTLSDLKPDPSAPPTFAGMCITKKRAGNQPQKKEQGNKIHLSGQHQIKNLDIEKAIKLKFRQISLGAKVKLPFSNLFSNRGLPFAWRI